MGLKKSWRNFGSPTLSAQAGKGAWPTLVIEAGVSQTLAQLRIGMQRWFSMSNHEVKIVLLAKFDAITITRDTTTDPISYHVTSGALVLSFRLLFLRDPGPGEGDLAFGVQELEEYAEK
ncbi:hypothetical protein B0H67DRAFT_562309, partial [Lasiosphaeris hirsuta]